jgi:hypothetical protein
MWWLMPLAGLGFQKWPCLDLDHLGIALCYVGTASEETRMLIQSSLMERVRVAQQQDRLLLEARKRVGDGKP